MDGFHIAAEAFHVVEVCVDRVKALHAGRPRGNDHMLACAHEFHTGAGNRGLQILGVVAAGERNAEQARGSLADFQRVHHAPGRLERSHDQGPAGFNAEFLFGCGNGFFHQLDVFRCLRLGNPDGVAAAGNRAADILAPEVGIQAVDADDTFHPAVIDLLQCMVQGIAGRILFLFGYRIFQIQHDGIGSVNVRILDEARLLAVQEHHASAKALHIRMTHTIAPPHGS